MQKSKRKTIRLTAGFTLLELIIAMALMNMIAVVLYTSMNISFKTKESCQSSLKPYQMVMPIFEYIRRDLTSVPSPDGIIAGLFVGEDSDGVDRQPADVINFYSAAYQPREDEIVSNIINIEYALEEDYDRDQYVLKRFTRKNILSPTVTDMEEEVIGRDIRGLNLEYYDGTTTTWVDEWDSSEQDGNLPWAVRVTISILDEDRSRFSRIDDPYRYFTRIFMLPFATQEAVSEEESEEEIVE